MQYLYSTCQPRRANWETNGHWLDNSYTHRKESLPEQVRSFAGLCLGLGFLVMLITVFIYLCPREDYSKLPTMSVAQYNREFHDLVVEIDRPPLKDPQEYFFMVAEQNKLTAMSQKLRWENSNPSHEVMVGFVGGLPDVIKDYDLYSGHFGPETMQKTGEKLRPWMEEQRVRYEAPTRVPTGSFAKLGVMLARMYGVTTMFALIYLAFRCKEERLKLWMEILNGRLVGASLLWLGAIWYYPTRVNPVEQAKSVMRFCASCVAGMLSFGAIVGGAAAQERDENESAPASGNVLVVTTIPKPVVSFTVAIENQKVITNGSLVHSGAVVYADQNVSYTNGWSVDFWESRALSGSRGSDEDDFSIAKSFKAGEWSPTIHLSYYDIAPIGTAKGGDFISPWFDASRSIGHGLSLFTTGDAYFLTSGTVRNNGYDLAVGLRGAHSIGPFTVSQGLSLVHANGPFGAKADLSVRSDTSVSVPITKRLQAVLSAKLFAPTMYVRPHGDNATFSFALATSF